MALTNPNYSPEFLTVYDAAAVTTSDTVDLAYVSKGLYVGGAGNVTVTLHSGAKVLFTAMAVGVVHRIAAKRVWATGTSATAIVALY